MAGNRKNSTKSYMANRALHSLSKEIDDISENINTWAVSLKSLIKLRRALLKNSKADRDLYVIADAFSKLFYKGHAKVDTRHVDSDSDSDSGSGSGSESDSNTESNNTGSDSDSNTESANNTPRKNSKQNKQNKHHKQSPTEPDADIDVDEFLREVVAAEQTAKDGKIQKPTAGMSKMQQAALKVLAEEDREVKDMDLLMAKRRRKMEEDMRKPQPTRPVKFTLDVDKTLDPKTGLPLFEDKQEDSEDGEVLAEEDISGSDSEVEVEVEAEVEVKVPKHSKVLKPAKLQKPAKVLLDENTEDDAILSGTLANDKAKHPSVLDLENALKNAMANITADESLHPLIAMQKDSPLFAGLPGFTDSGDSVCANPVMSNPGNPSNPAVQTAHTTFSTPDPPEFDPKYGPLYRMTAPQRAKMFQQWFKRASTNVDSQLSKNPASPTTRNRLIREETFRLQENYLETR